MGLQKTVALVAKVEDLLEPEFTDPADYADISPCFPLFPGRSYRVYIFFKKYNNNYIYRPHLLWDIWSTKQLKIKIMALCYNPTMNQFMYCIVSALSFFLFLSFSISSFLPCFLSSILLTVFLVTNLGMAGTHPVFTWDWKQLDAVFLLASPPPPSPSVWRVAVASCPHLQFGAVEFETEVKYTGGFVFTPSSPTKQNKSNRKLEKEKKKQKWVLRQSSAGSSFHFDVNCNLL